jgi:hypothetical protein
MKWKYFVGACLVVAGALLKAGAPPVAVVAGIALASGSNLLRQRLNSAGPKSVAAKGR